MACSFSNGRCNAAHVPRKGATIHGATLGSARKIWYRSSPGTAMNAHTTSACFESDSFTFCPRVQETRDNVHRRFDAGRLMRDSGAYIRVRRFRDPEKCHVQFSGNRSQATDLSNSKAGDGTYHSARTRIENVQMVMADDLTSYSLGLEVNDVGSDLEWGRL